jgi:hypothetical protein
VPDDGEGRAPRQRPGPAARTTTTYSPAILPDQADKHCPRCVCRCRCHRRPELPVRAVPPRPGDPFWSAHLAALSFELGDLAAAYAAVERRVAA